MYAAYFLLSLALLRVSVSASRPESWPCEWHTWPKGTPTQSFPDGPIVGNGNIGVTIGGGDGEITIYMTTHGFYAVNNGTISPFPPLTKHVDISSVAGSQGPLTFPGCPADNCTIPVGGTIGGLVLSSPAFQGGNWTALLWLDNATARVTLTSPVPDGPQLQLTAWVSATEQVAVFELANTGAADLTGLNVSSWANDNVLRVRVNVSCADPLDGTPLPTGCPSNGTSLTGQYLEKDATRPEGSVLFITGALAWIPLSPSALPASTSPYVFSVPQSYWAGGSVVTQTHGLTSFIDLPAGQSIALAATAVASRDAGIYPTPLPDVVSSRLSGLTASSVPSLYTAHTEWWDNFWSASGIALDSAENATEAFWYSSLYALGSGSRAGQLAMDLWSPWRTTDYPLWRSNPTLDYNQQALYSGMFGANHVELAEPYYDFIDIQVATGGPGAEAAALGCPGVHFSVDLSQVGIKLGVTGEPQDWGILSNAAYAAMTYVYQWETTVVNATWVRARAWPFLTSVAAFWQCKLNKTAVPTAPNGYEYWDVNDCTGDEGCHLPSDERTNPMWGNVYIRRVFETLVQMAPVAGQPVDPMWADILSHWPPIPVAAYTDPKTGEQVPVLGWYGQSNYTNFGGQANELAAVWPGGLVSMSTPNQALITAAQNALKYQNWGQDNSFSWVYSAAARSGVSPSTIFRQWHAELASALSRPNRLVAFGGLCSDSLGAIVFIHDTLVQGQEGFLRLFPAWPANASAAFTNLRLAGALLVSAQYVPPPAHTLRLAQLHAQRQGHTELAAGQTGGVVALTITSEAGGSVQVLSPWPSVPHSSVWVCDVTASEEVSASLSIHSAAPCTSPLSLTWSTIGGTNGGDAFAWQALASHTYSIGASGSHLAKV